VVAGLLDGFEPLEVEVNGILVRGRVAGSGLPVLLLHGYPQTHVMWHHVAPSLASSRTVVLADLRGYGGSAKPAGGLGHASYSKRAMAADQVGLMAALGFEHFAAIGHDRGARVVHRMCLDFPERVERAAVLDIVPTRHVLATADVDFGLAYEHWFFLAQPADFPERLIGRDPEFYLRAKLARWAAPGHRFHAGAMDEYVRHFRDPAAVAASCEDYRAAVSIDREHDERSHAAGERVRCPLLALWGSAGFVGRHYDVATIWRDHVSDSGLVHTVTVDSGHFVAEEAPAATLAALSRFLG
jgi:haloacetate dehalogenase